MRFGLLFAVLASCTQSSPPPEVQVELHGVFFREAVGGVIVSHFDAKHGPRWSITPPTVKAARLRLEGPTFTGTVAVDLERRDQFLIAKSATLAIVGPFIATLEADGHDIWQAKLRWAPAPESVPALKKALDLKTTDPGAAATYFETVTHDPSPWKRFQAYLLWGRMAHSRSLVSAREIWTRGFDDLSASDIPRLAQILGGNAAFGEIGTGRLELGRQVIKRLEVLDAQSDDVYQRAVLFHFKGSLASQAKEPSQAVEHWRKAQDLAWRCGDDDMWAIALGYQAAELLALGQFSAALEAQQRANTRYRRPRNKLMGELNTLWIRLWGEESGTWPPRTDDLIRQFQTLHKKMSAKGTAATEDDRMNVATCIAYLALRRGDVDMSNRWLRDSAGADHEDLGWERWFIGLVRAEAQLRSGHFEGAEAALESIIEGVRREAGDRSPYEVVARGLGVDILVAQGRKEDALQALNEAWHSSLRVARQLDQIGAKNHFLHLHRALPMRYARAVLQAGDALGGAAVIDEHLYEGGSQMRALSTRRSNPELWRPVKEARAALAAARRINCKLDAPDQRVVCRGRVKTAQQAVLGAELSFYAKLQTPRRADAKAALVQRQARLGKGEGLLLSAGDGADLQAFLLTKIAIVPAQGLQALAALGPHLEELSALQVAGPLDPWAQISPDAQPWAARLAIYYSQYARTPAAAAAPSLFPGPTLLVADPSHNLTKTAKRIAHWQKRFGVTALRNQGATRAAVLKGLKQRPALFFFSGHSVHDDLDQTSTRIVLSKSHIDLQDVLAEKLGPRLVVLNGCSTGASQAGYGAGLPEAFMHQGTEAVLGTTRVLKDGGAEAFLDRFFDASATQSPVLAMRDAVRASIEAKDDSWKNLRLWR